MGRVRIVAASDASREGQVRERWERLLDQYAGTTLFYQSPEYFDHLAKSCPDCAFLAVIEGDDGATIGVVPMRRTPFSLRFSARDRRLANASFSCIRILGATLLAPPSPEVFEQVFRGIAESFPECEAIEAIGLSTTSPLWAFLRDNPSLKEDFTLYAPNGRRSCHTVSIPDSFAEYLGAFRHKKRYNLMRQLRRLDLFGNGSLALQRIDCVSGVRCFIDARVAMGGRARWDGNGEVPEIEVEDLAERGLLLSYVLRVNGRPCGLAFGTRYRETLVMHTFRHDVEISHLSPGTVLQTLIVKDLIEHKLVQRIDYGFGEPRYRLSNDVDERVTVVMLRRRIVNQLLVTAHLSYVRLLTGVKRFTRIGSRDNG